MATNRDEMLGRPWLPPGRHWPEYPGIVAGLDCLGRGSWMGVNRQGVVAAVTNRTGTLGPEKGKHSRGQLVLEALQYPRAATALTKIQHLEPSRYRGFNLVLADAIDAFWLFHRASTSCTGFGYMEVPEGLSMLTDRDLNDERSERISHYLQLFQTAAEPNPIREDGWALWKELLSDRGLDRDADSRSAMNVSDGEFATLSSSLIAIPKLDKPEYTATMWWFAAGPPDRAFYRRVDI